MKNTLAIVLMFLAVSPGVAPAAGLDGSQPLLCASNTVIECLPVEGCRQVSPQAVAAPAFLRLDFASKTLSAAGADGAGRSSIIERSETIDSKLILQGAEDGIEGVRDGTGWTIAIATDTGRMVLTAAGDDAAFTIFGACTAM